MQHFGKSDCVRQSGVKLLSNFDLLLAVALTCELLLLVLLLLLLSLLWTAKAPAYMPTWHTASPWGHKQTASLHHTAPP